MDAFEEFMYQYGRPDGRYPVIDVGDAIDQWPTIVITFGHLTAVVQCCGCHGVRVCIWLCRHELVEGVFYIGGFEDLEQPAVECGDDVCLLRCCIKPSPRSLAVGFPAAVKPGYLDVAT